MAIPRQYVIEVRTPLTYSLKRLLFVETQAFTREVEVLLLDGELAALQEHLSRFPNAGAVIPGTGGLRKLRWSCRGRGKRGGVRVIYFHFERRQVIGLLLIYDKTVDDDLSSDQKRQLRAIVEGW